MHDLREPDLFRQECLIGGRWMEAANGETLKVRDPATGEVLGSVPCMGEEETRKAIEVADEAFGYWRELVAKERGACLRRWHELLVEHQDDLAYLITREQGKPLAEARGEVLYAASYMDWFAEEARRVYGDVIPSGSPDKRIAVVKQPVGVCAAITPWNFPIAMLARKAAAALAAGCTIVAKPAEATPYSALALGLLAQRAGIPDGVFNMVTGSPVPIGRELCSNATVRKLSFTGSTAVGRLLMEQSAPSIKKLSLELGGNAPFIVFDDADPAEAVKGAIDSKFRNAGQTCVCANRFLVQDGIYDEFVSRLADAVSSDMTVGNGLEPGVNQGPLIDKDALGKVETHVSDALAKGGRLVTGGDRHSLGGTFFQPTVIAEANPEMLIAGNETFGPVAPVFRFRTAKEAVELANDTEYGLAAYLFSRDISRAWRVAELLEYGMVGINTGLISAAEAPFGGVKASGMGREGSHYGLDDYLEIKYLCIGGIRREV